MPSHPRRPGLPVFYLDTSTLSDGFRAAAGDSSVARCYLPLRDWVERVASEANLCLSLVHVEELANWPQTAVANALVDWLDELDTIWARAEQYVRPEEDEYQLKRIAGCPHPVRPEPFAPSLLRTFEDAPVEQVAAMLNDPSMGAMLRAYRDRGADALRGLMPSHHQALRADRAAAEARGVTAERLAARLALQHRTDLRRKAMEAHDRLQRHADYVDTGATKNTVVDPFERAYAADRSTLPSTAVVRAWLDGFGAGTVEWKAGGARTRKRLQGGTADLMHAAIGAAYCDVFTCDATTAAWLGDVRADLGHGRPPLYLQGDSAAFVSQLMSTWP